MKQSDIILSVIIPCLNGAEYIEAELKALSRQDWSERWEVIVSDNGSTDGSQEIVMGYKDILPGLRIVDASDRRGQPHALNVGVQTALSNAVAFCDADDEVGPGWVRAMGEALKKHDFVAGAFDTEKLNITWLQKSHDNSQKAGLGEYGYPPFLPHAGSGNMGVRKRVHDSVGGFDETMPILFDTDYCWRVQLSGVKLHFVADAVLHLRYRESLMALYQQARNYGQYNVLLYKKYLPYGMPKLSKKLGIQKFWYSMKSLHRVRRKSDLARWVWGFGWSMGRLKGSIRYGIFAL